MCRTTGDGYPETPPVFSVVGELSNAGFELCLSRSSAFFGLLIRAQYRNCTESVLLSLVFTTISSEMIFIVACRTPIENAGAAESVTLISRSYSTHHLEIGAFFRHHLSEKHRKVAHCLFDSPAFISCSFFSNLPFFLHKDRERDQQRSSDRRCSACFVCLHREHMPQPDG